MVEYALEFMRKFDRIPEDRVRLNVAQTFSVPFRRHGVEDRENPEKTRDEVLRAPAAPLFIPKEVLAKGEEVIQTKRFTPEYVVNLNGIRVEGEDIMVEANLTNYGVLPTLREQVSIFPESVMNPVLGQIAPVAVRGTFVSFKDKKIYLARRANTVQSGKIETYPAGTVSEGDDLSSALRNEAREEAGFRIGEDGNAYLIGVVRGRKDGPNPNFNYLIETDWTLEKFREKVGKEHDKVYAVDLNGDALRKFITTEFVSTTSDHDKTPDVSLAALLQVGQSIFGDKWFEGTLEELQAKVQLSVLKRS